MDSIKPSSGPSIRRLAKTFEKVIHVRRAKTILSKSSFCLLEPQEKPNLEDPQNRSQLFDKDDVDEAKQDKNRAAMEAFIAKLFAAISAVKAAYVELQMAHFPYIVDAVQPADQAVIDELKALSELKQCFLKKQIDSSPPHVTLLLAEIQEQQSLMKTYEITMKKMQSEIDSKDAQIFSLQEELNDLNLSNKSLKKKLNASGSLSVLDHVKLSDSNPKDLVVVLHYCLRSMRNFVKLLVSEMESANWDIGVAADAIQPGIRFSKPNHRCYAFESFVCKEMFDGFNDPRYLHTESFPAGEQLRYLLFDQFQKLKSVGSIHFLKQSPHSWFGKFTRTKYLCLVHPKMEMSFSGYLNQRKMINAGEFPETAFFMAFAEMARRVWLLQCLAMAFSLEQEVSIFQVEKKCRFSEVYMENVNDDVLVAADGDSRVAFTVVPGFKIGKTVILSQVYLSAGETRR